ncbi:hypothetical protein B1759_15055 [Rubrivirga sp. SAORIC476]|uniref:hypothetical protein n=1 Tax=Rubrivirga sp. SAORIC476 TaxID=1961794 RepID=UPI000BA9C36C|nr:hypothetical protein [Rubrivirga sp. SAORIC476]PAP79635.1 hypothetical protein B1759_15055 [Rubrivirga sp. SAORIC476]
MSLDQLAAGAGAALGDDIVREILSAAIGMARGEVRDLSVEIAADRRPIVVVRRVTKGLPIPKV